MDQILPLPRENKKSTKKTDTFRVIQIISKRKKGKIELALKNPTMRIIILAPKRTLPTRSTLRPSMGPQYILYYVLIHIVWQRIENVIKSIHNHNKNPTNRVKKGQTCS